MTIRTKIDNSGNLVFTADNSGRRDLAEAYAAGGYPYADQEVFEAVVPNSELEFIPPKQIGALTDAPIIGEAIYLSCGGMEVWGRVWWFPDYQVRDPWDELRRRGRVVFVLASQDKPSPKPLDPITKRVLSALYGVKLPSLYTFGKVALLAMALACGAARADAAPYSADRDCDVTVEAREAGVYYMRLPHVTRDRWHGPFASVHEALSIAAAWCRHD